MTRLQHLIGNELSEGKTYRQIALDIGLNHVSISQYHKGIIPDAKNLAILSKYFRINFADLLIEMDSFDLSPFPPPSGLIPVVSMASANGDGPCWEDAYLVGQGMEMIWRPHDVIDAKAFGIKVDGDSMIPVFRPGDVVVVCPQKQVVNGDEVVAKLKDGRVVVKVIRYINGHVLLESYNQSHDPIFTEKDQLDFAYKIVWHKRG